MNISDRIASVQERIENACLRAGRKRDGIRLMAVSKFHGAHALLEAWNSGLRLYGESRVQEAAAKFPALRELHPELELHMIGPLQRNKAKSVFGLFQCVQSVDRIELIMELGKRWNALAAGGDGAQSAPLPLDLLLELHTGEESKLGFPDADSLCSAAEAAAAFPGLRIRGLMTMAPYTKDLAPIRSSFRSLAAAQGFLRSRFPEQDWSVLSMGMSNDFEIAVEEGATLLRVGTAIFGEAPRGET